MAKIAFIGAGMMGSAMVKNYLKHGHQVRVYNRTPAKAEPLVALGAARAATPAAATAGAEVVIVSVTNDEASRTCWLGPDGILSGHPAPGAFAVEASTVSLDWIHELQGLAEPRGLRFLDCPVAGRPDVAEAGQLKIFAGGRAEDVEALRPIFAAVANGITHMGPVGAGITFKLIYNLMGAVQVVAVAEGMAACEAAGIDLKLAAEGFSVGATGSPHVKRHAKYMAENRHENPIQFSARMRVKDIAYGIQVIESAGAQAALGHAARQVFEQTIGPGTFDRNDSELFEALRLYTRARLRHS